MVLSQFDSPDSFALSRRDLLKAAAGASLLAAVGGFPRSGHAQGSDAIKIGFIGCGGQGTKGVRYALKAGENIHLVAMGDVYQDRLNSSLEKLRQEFPNQVKVTPETSFVGWDSYQKVLATDCNVAFLTTPPYFRPMHYRAAVEAGKHVFMEKPVAVDPVGVRSIIETAALGDQKNLKALVGTQGRRLVHREELVKRIAGGEIGDIISVKCVRTGDAMRGWGPQERTPEMTDMDWQLRRWLFHTWLAGDFIVEMHIHELDAVNMLLADELPEKCRGLGGRQARFEPTFGDAFDHFAVAYDYPGGKQVQYLGEQIDGTTHSTFERVYGTKGIAYTDWSGSRIEKGPIWKYEGPDHDPSQQQQINFVNAIRNNTPLNDSVRAANSTMTAILGRMSAYTGKELKWDWAMKASKLDLSPQHLAFGPAPEVAVPIPGKTPLV